MDIKNYLMKAENKYSFSWVLEQIYLLLFCVLIGYHFFLTTMFSIEWPSLIQFYLNSAIVLILVLKTGVDEKYNIKEILIVAVLGAAFLIAWRHNENEEILLCMLVIWGARKINFEKILKVFFAVIAILLIFTVICSLTGHVENLIFYQGDRRARMAFGVCYPTDFSAYVFFLSVVYCYLRKEKLRYLETIGVAALGLLVYYFCDARMNTICLLLTAILFSYLIFMRRRQKKKGKEYEMHKGLAYLLALSPTICATVMILLSMFYSSQNRILSILNSMLNNRIYYSHKGMELYGIPLWGQYVPMRGNGGTTEVIRNYFFLDSSYISILLQFGVLTLVTILICWCLISFKAVRYKNWGLLLAVALIAAQCMVEHHMMAIVYNPFFMAVLADWSAEKSRRRRHSNEKDMEKA